MARYFTLEQASAVLPQMAERLERALHAKAGLERMSGKLEGLAHKASMTGGLLVNREKALSMANRREALARRLKELIEEIHREGCQVKDLDRGLLDFPTLYRGEEVLLCWKLGEPSIRYWHGPEEGFAGRKEIDRDFLENHQGDPAH